LREQNDKKIARDVHQTGHTRNMQVTWNKSEVYTGKKRKCELMQDRAATVDRRCDSTVKTMK
jgi:hypothetical protein